jgi:bifunctional DNA-binding transcriptional regulator/antitoxin component of YhaV-PrlF toxin-antitoxin module
MATTTQTEEMIAHLRATTMTVAVGTEGGLVLPDKIQQAAGLVDGDLVYVRVTDEGGAGLQIRLAKIDPDQAWFWTPEWQAKEREADEERAAGRFTTYQSDEEFLAALKQWSHDADL